jgi:hypothetical protein
MAKFIVVHSVKVATEFVPETFGRLTTIGPKFQLPVGKKGEYTSRQVCQCTCGKTVTVTVNNLMSGAAQSCGCLSRERASQANTVHGMAKSPEYSIYKSMKKRCMNPNDGSYDNYGGRGIRVCGRWLEPDGRGFLNFLEDMRPRPSKTLSIERELVDGDYCPENCHWATKTEQGRNRRNNHLLTFNDKTQCIAAWAEELGYSPYLIHNRLRRGWSVAETLTTPVQAMSENDPAS